MPSSRYFMPDVLKRRRSGNPERACHSAKLDRRGFSVVMSRSTYSTPCSSSHFLAFCRWNISGYSKNNTLMNSPFRTRINTPQPMCAGRKPTNHARNASLRSTESSTHAKRWARPTANTRQTVGPPKAPPIPQPPTATSQPNAAPVAPLRALGARPVGHVANRSSERVGSMVGMGHLVQASKSASPCTEPGLFRRCPRPLPRA